MKSQIRAQVLETRSRMTKQEVAVKSALIAEKLMDLNEVKSAKNLLLYSSKGNEVDTTIIFDKLKDKAIYYPRTVVEKGVLELYRITNLDQLEPGAFGLTEPKKDQEKGSASNVDVSIIPAVAFDEKGNRVGYGLGFYDKLLKKVAGTKIGLCYEIQITDNFLNEEHDVKADIIITEKRVIMCGVEK